MTDTQPDDQRTLRRELHPVDGYAPESSWVGTTDRLPEGRWPGPTPEAVIRDMNARLGPQPDTAYRVVEGTAG